MQDKQVMAYLRSHYKHIDYSISRDNKEEEAAILRSSAELHLLETIGTDELEKWLPSGMEGEISEGVSYKITQDGSVFIDNKPLIFGDVIYKSNKKTPKRNLLEFYRLYKSLLSIDIAAREVHKQLSVGIKTANDIKFISQYPDKDDVPIFNISDDYVGCIKIFTHKGKKTVLPMFSQLKMSSRMLIDDFYLPCSFLYNEQLLNNADAAVILTDSVEIASLNQAILTSNPASSIQPYKEKIIWLAWCHHKDAVDDIDWALFKDRRVYYLLKNHSGFTASDIFTTALKAYNKLRENGAVEVKFILAMDRLFYTPTMTDWYIIPTGAFLKYATPMQWTNTLPIYKQSAITRNSFITNGSISFFYGPRKSGISSYVQQLLRKVNTTSPLNVLSIYRDRRKALRLGYKNGFGECIAIGADLIDITSKDVQGRVEVELMIRALNGYGVNLLVLDDLDSLNKLVCESAALNPEEELEDINRMNDWLESLQVRNIAVIIIPPGKAWSDMQLRNIMKLFLDNIIRVDKEKAHDSSKIALSLHYEMIEGATKFQLPETYECQRKGKHPLLWKQVDDKNAELNAVDYEIRRLVRSGWKNEDIATRLKMTISMVKKKRRILKLSKPHKKSTTEQLQAQLNAEAKHNENLYEVVNDFLRARSFDAIDIIGTAPQDGVIIKYHRAGLAPQQIVDKMKSYNHIEFPLNLVVKTLKQYTEADKELSRELPESCYVVSFEQVEVPVEKNAKQLMIASAITMTGTIEVLGIQGADEASTAFVELVEQIYERGFKKAFVVCVSEDLLESAKEHFVDSDIRLNLSKLILDVENEHIKEVTRMLSELNSNSQAQKRIADLLVTAKRTKRWSNAWDNIAIYFFYPSLIRKAIVSHALHLEWITKTSLKIRDAGRTLPDDNLEVMFFYLANSYGIKWRGFIKKWVNKEPAFNKHFNSSL